MSKLNNLLTTVFLVLAIVSLLVMVPFYIQHSIKDFNSKLLFYSQQCFNGNTQEVKDGVSGCAGAYSNLYYRNPFVRD